MRAALRALTPSAASVGRSALSRGAPASVAATIQSAGPGVGVTRRSFAHEPTATMQWADALQIETLLTDDEKMIRVSAAAVW